MSITISGKIGTSKGRSFLYVMIGVIVLIIIASISNQITKVKDLGSTCPQELINFNFTHNSDNSYGGKLLFSCSSLNKTGYSLDYSYSEYLQIHPLDRKNIKDNDVCGFNGCYIGNAPGENKNLYYCPVSFRKQVISDTGVIGKTYSIPITYVFDKEGTAVEKKCT